MTSQARTYQQQRAAIVRRHLRQGWRGQLGWSAGIALVIGLYLPLFPSLQSPELAQLIDSLPRELVQTLGYDDIASGAGYTQATFFSLLGFVLMSIASVSWGAAFIAGAEESGRLELTLAHAVGRLQYSFESAVAVILKVLLLGVVAFVLILALNRPAKLDLDPNHLVAVTTAWVSLGLVSGLAALAAGAFTGRRSWAFGAGAGVAVLGYGLDALAATSDRFTSLAELSPYHWAFGKQPLAEGFDWLGLGFLWLAAAALTTLATWALSRRDIVG